MKTGNEIPAQEMPAGNRVLISLSRSGVNNSLINDELKKYLMEWVSISGTTLELGMGEIDMISSDELDTMNLLARIARKYRSVVKLQGVNENLLEMIALIRQYWPFEIRSINNREDLFNRQHVAVAN